MVNSTVNKDYIVLGENICNAFDRQGVYIKIFFQRKRKHSNRKRVKNMNRQFMEEDVQITNKYKNRCCLISLIVEWKSQHQNRTFHP